MTQVSYKPHQKQELSLDQAVNLRNSGSREFCGIHFGIHFWVKYNHPNSAQFAPFSGLPSGKESIEQECEPHKFHVIHFCSSSITRILCNSHQFCAFSELSQESNLANCSSPDLHNCIHLIVGTTEVRDKVNRSKSVSVAIDKK